MSAVVVVVVVVVVVDRGTSISDVGVVGGAPG